MSGKHTKFYLDKQNAKWRGVCAGIADYTGVDVLWVRLGAVMFTLMGGFPWTLIAYVITAWMAHQNLFNSTRTTVKSRNSGKVCVSHPPAPLATFAHAFARSITGWPRWKLIMSATTSSWPKKSKACADPTSVIDYT